MSRERARGRGFEFAFPLGEQALMNAQVPSDLRQIVAFLGQADGVAFELFGINSSLGQRRLLF